jgi:hypothetical protein
MLVGGVVVGLARLVPNPDDRSHALRIARSIFLHHSVLAEADRPLLDSG